MRNIVSFIKDHANHAHLNIFIENLFRIKIMNKKCYYCFSLRRSVKLSNDSVNKGVYSDNVGVYSTSVASESCKFGIVVISDGVVHCNVL